MIFTSVRDVYQNAKRARAQLTSVQNAAQRRQTGFSMPRHVDAEMGTMMTLHPISKAAKSVQKNVELVPSIQSAHPAVTA